jgi:hypothetical protein
MGVAPDSGPAFQGPEHFGDAPTAKTQQLSRRTVLGEILAKEFRACRSVAYKPLFGTLAPYSDDLVGWVQLFDLDAGKLGSSQPSVRQQ